MLTLGLKSILNRRFTVSLTVLAVALSVALLLGVERLRDAARAGFTETVTGLDLIIAARGDDLPILLATVFGIGSTTNSIGWNTFERLAARPGVLWAVPIAQGDSHRGFPVIGTTPEYFRHFRYGNDTELSFREGVPFVDEDGAVLGADVARRFDYSVGSVIVNSHGSGEVAFAVHYEAPFTVTGILAPTGTPVDRMVFVSLEGFAAIHAPYRGVSTDPLAIASSPDGTLGLRRRPTNQRAEAHGDDDGRSQVFDRAAVVAPQDDEHKEHSRDDSHAGDAHNPRAGARSRHRHADQDDRPHGHGIEEINAIYIGLESPTAVLSLQRAIATDPNEPLTGVMPAVALTRLWSLTGMAESALRAVAVAVVAAGLISLVVMLTATLEARRREFAVLRSLGATPGGVSGLILVEALLVAASGVALGLLVLAFGAVLAGSTLSDRVGLSISPLPSSAREYVVLLSVAMAAIAASLVPAWRVFRTTLADGLSIRL